MDINFRIQVKKKHIYILSLMAVLAIAGGLVSAFGTTNPSTFGHSAGEVIVNSTSVVDGTLLSADTDVTSIQSRVASTCAAGSSIRVIASDGTVTCETDDVGGGGFSTQGIFSASVPVPSSGTATAGVCCPGVPGTISGGGCDVVGTSGELLDSRPRASCVSSNGWECRYFNPTGASVTATATAICLG